AKVGTNYTAAAGMLTFAAGQTNQAISVAITDNTQLDGDKWLRCILSKPNGGAVLGNRTNAWLTIHDNEYEVSEPDSGFSASFSGSVGAMALEKDGRIVVTGSLCLGGAGCNQQVWRLLPNGSLDSSFQPLAAGLTRLGYTATFT